MYIPAAPLFSLDKSTVPSFILTPGLKATLSQRAKQSFKGFLRIYIYPDENTSLFSQDLVHVLLLTQDVKNIFSVARTNFIPTCSAGCQELWHDRKWIPGALCHSTYWPGGVPTTFQQRMMKVK